MKGGRDLFALDWVKGELFDTLDEARQALEAYVELGREETRMRVCLTRLHQVHGTLVMLELQGVATLADQLERLAQSLSDGSLQEDLQDQGCQLLMQGLLELPERLERIHNDSAADNVDHVIELVNEIATLLGLETLPEVSPLQQETTAEVLDRFERIDGAGKIRRIRAAYQNVLLSILKGEDEAKSLQTLHKVAVGLERVCQDSPVEALWQAFGEFVKGLAGVARPLPADVVKVLRRIDAEIRRFARDGADALLAPVPERLIAQLVEATIARGAESDRLTDLRRRASLAEGNDELGLSGRRAIASAAQVMREELVVIKDEIDLFARSAEPELAKLSELIEPLDKIATTCSVLGFESSRTIIMDQTQTLEAMSNAQAVDPSALMSVASALVQLDENLARIDADESVVDEPRFSSDAEKQVLREARVGLDEVKQAVVDFVSSQFETATLGQVSSRIAEVCGALEMVSLDRPIALLHDCRAFIQLELPTYASADSQVNWERLDRFADCVSGIDYYLERITEDSKSGADDVLDVVERGLVGLGFAGRGADLGPIEPGDSGAEEEPVAEEVALDDAAPQADELQDTAADLAQVPQAAVEDIEAPVETTAAPDEDLTPVSEEQVSEQQLPNEQAVAHFEPPTETSDQPIEPLGYEAKPQFDLAPENLAEVEPDAETDWDEAQLEREHLEAVAEISEEAHAAALHDAEAHNETGFEPDAGIVSAPESDVFTDDEALTLESNVFDEVVEAADADDEVADATDAALEHDLELTAAAPDADEDIDDADHTEQEQDLTVEASDREQSLLEDAPQPPADDLAFAEEAEPPAMALEAPEASEIETDAVAETHDEPFDTHLAESERQVEVTEQDELSDQAEADFAAPAAADDWSGDDLEFDLSSEEFDQLVPTGAPLTEEVQDEPATSDGDGDLVDQEIIDVFVEEALEVLEVAQTQFAEWQTNLADHAPLTDLRRGFHTLKGSGRMVGAAKVGELAWSIENMLNRILDGTLETSDGHVQTVQAALAMMPGLVDAFTQSQQGDVDAVAEVVDAADLLASGGSLEQPSDVVPVGEELQLFAEEAKAHIQTIHSRTGRRRVQLDDATMLALHTLSGSARVVALTTFGDVAEALYEVARAQVAEALRGPNTEVEVARLFQEAVSYFERRIENLSTQDDAADDAARTILSKSGVILSWADESPAEEMLVGLAQLNVLMEAPDRLADWQQGQDVSVFYHELRAALNAIIGATFRPQVTDLSKALLATTSSLDPEQSLSERTANALREGCERLLNVVDAIAGDQSLPRVDDIVTVLSDLDSKDWDSEEAETPVASESDTESDDQVDTTDTATLQFDAAAAELEVPSSSVADSGVVNTDDYTAVDTDLAEVFFEEAEEICQALEEALHGWLIEPDNRLHVENALRGLHTLKGGARLAGLSSIGDRAHQFESLLSAHQAQQAPAEKTLIADAQSRCDEIIQALNTAQQAIFAPPSPQSAAPETPAKPRLQVVSDGTKAPESDAVEEAPQRPAERAGQEMVRVRSGLLESLVNLAGENSILRARVEQGMSDFSSALDEMEMTIDRLREQLRRLEIETEAQVLYRQEQLDPSYESFDPLEMDRYSQLQQLSRGLSESASDMLDLKDTLLFKAREAETLLLQQGRVNSELQEGLMRTRMVPFSRLLPRLRRIVRQIATELDKEVEFHAYNAEGELDRNLLERMIPPLEHMLRNGVDHGIETPEVRRSFGKAAPGRIDLRLSREGGDIVIEIADDGAGIDVEAVRSKAHERGLLRPDVALGDDEVMEFVLAPGFSTAKSVTQISGRGVGLDVVNSEVKKLGGSVSISSSPGKGTRFVVRVPFTVSVNRALMVSVGDDLYAVPLNTIEGIVLLDPAELERLYGSDDKTFEYAGVSYRIRYLGHYIGRQHPANMYASTVPVVLVRSGDQAIAVHVDAVQGSREIVVKSLGPQFAGVGGISGATILGDGSVVVILDLLALIRSHGRDSMAALRKEVVHDTRHRCVMVVDDSVTVRKVTSRLLERQGMEVIVAKDGVEAIALLQERRPDIILLDIEMPRMDGFEVARQVRHEVRLADLPIVMISSRTGNKHTEHAEELGVNRFLGKPFQENELLAAIDELAAPNVL